MMSIEAVILSRKTSMDSRIFSEESRTKMCIFHASSGDTVKIPYFLVSAVVPAIADILLDQNCCQLEDVDVILPDVSLVTLSAIKQLVTVGHCSTLRIEVIESVTRFLPHLILERIQCCTPDLCEEEADKMGTENDAPEDSFQNLVGNVSFNDAIQSRKDVVSLASYKVNSFCSKTCINCCHDTVLSWPDEDRLRLKQKFLSDKIVETKTKLMSHLIAQDDTGQSTTAFIIKGHHFCVDYFAWATGISLYISRKVLMDFQEGYRMYCHGNSQSIRSKSASTISAICWLKSFGESYGQCSPEQNVIVLSYWLTKQCLYKMYVDETPDPHISQSSFYTMFKTSFGHRREDKSLPWIRISKYSTHSVCVTCVALNNNQRQAKTEKELQQALDLKNNHRMEFGMARRKVEEIKQSSLSFPSDNLFLQIDSMDNSKSYLPHYLEHSKDQVQKERLPSKITGCTMYSSWYVKNRKVIFFINHDQYENGSNMIITIIYNLLQDFVADHKKLPRKLHLNLDNCWKENKNRFLFSFLASLVELNVFEEITVNYLLVGHTGNEVDQLFSIICPMLKVDITTIEILRDRILSAPIEPKPICRNLDFIYDWKQFVGSKLANPPLRYQSKYNSFRVNVENRNGKRLVVFRAKKLPQDSHMVPRAGIRLLQEGIDYIPIGSAEFRVEPIKFDLILRGIHIFLSRKSREERRPVLNSWDKLRDHLEGLPRRSNSFPKMNLLDFPKQTYETISIPEYLEEVEYEFELTGDLYPEEVEDGDLDQEITTGMDVCVYTTDKRWRPWVGRVVELLEGRRFLIHWYSRKSGRGKKFEAMSNESGERCVSVMEYGSVMTWQMSENRTSTSFTLSNFWLNYIAREYSNYDVS